MVLQDTIHRFASVTFFLLALIFSTSASIAQNTTLNLIQTAEYDIGFDCPVSSTLDPTGTTIWVLMDNCFQSRYSLKAFNVADGTQVNEEDYADALTILNGIYVDLFITPIGFTPSGDISIRYNDPDTYESTEVLLSQATGEVTSQTSDSYNTLMAGFSDYPEYSVYSLDHTRVVVSGDTSLHVVDVQAESEIVEIPVEGGADSVIPAFSTDGNHLDVIQFNPDDMEDQATTLFIYSLPDGALIQQYALPSSAVWVSPDETLAAVQLYSNNVTDLSELVIVDLETGTISDASNLLEDPTPVTTCLNTGNDVSDIGYMTTGYFTLASLHWLPDSSGIILSLSYNGEGAQGGGSTCAFNYSRLRTYMVENTG